MAKLIELSYGKAEILPESVRLFDDHGDYSVILTRDDIVKICDEQYDVRLSRSPAKPDTLKKEILLELEK